MSPTQASGAYRRWQLPSFDEPLMPAPVDDAPALAADPEPEPPPPEPVFEAPVELEPEIPIPEPHIHLPTADEIERIHEEARKEGYDAGYEEATARGRMEAMQLHGLVQSLENAMTSLDQEVADEILAVAIEVARQMVRHSLAHNPESVAELIREALLQLPQAHAMVHLNPEDLAMVRDYLGEQLTHGGHRLVEDASVARGGARIEAAGSQIDATLQTRWRRIMDNLGRNVLWDGDGS